MLKGKIASKWVGTRTDEAGVSLNRPANTVEAYALILFEDDGTPKYPPVVRPLRVTMPIDGHVTVEESFQHPANWPTDFQLQRIAVGTDPAIMEETFEIVEVVNPPLEWLNVLNLGNHIRDLIQYLRPSRERRFDDMKTAAKNIN